MTGFLLSFVIGDKKIKMTGNFVTLLCNRPSDISLTVSLVFRKKFHSVAKFSTRSPLSTRSLFCLFQKYTNDICWVCKSRTGEATNGPGEIRGTLNFQWVNGKNPLLQRCVFLQVNMPGVDATLLTSSRDNG